jgi:hypothetical protein
MCVHIYSHIKCCSLSIRMIHPPRRRIVRPKLIGGPGAAPREIVTIVELNHPVLLTSTNKHMYWRQRGNTTVKVAAFIPGRSPGRKPPGKVVSSPLSFGLRIVLYPVSSSYRKRGGCKKVRKGSNRTGSVDGNK